MTTLEIVLFMAFLVSNARTHNRSTIHKYKEKMNEYVNDELQTFRKTRKPDIGGGRVLFFLYKKVNGKTVRSVESMHRSKKLHNGWLDCTLPLKVGFHGWQQKMDTLFVKKMEEAYSNTAERVQFVIVRWFGADQGYVAAKMSIPEAAKVIHMYLIRLTEETQCIELKDITLVGHSLGAQLAGAVGNRIRGDIGKIVALDPAYPLFWETALDAVSRSSARWVVGVHTNPGYYGVDWNVGHVDFWANMGESPSASCIHPDKTQRGHHLFPPKGANIYFDYGDPLVLQLSCSHVMSIHLFFDSVRNPEKLMAQECDCTHTSHCEFRSGESLLSVFFNEMTSVPGQFCFFIS
uniref:Phospholipase A1 member A n=1 Tax=Lygus hesperus TaxID=30085 RepID=A0A0A9Z6M4_LYGHE